MVGRLQGPHSPIEVELAERDSLRINTAWRRRGIATETHYVDRTLIIQLIAELSLLANASLKSSPPIRPKPPPIVNERSTCLMPT